MNRQIILTCLFCLITSFQLFSQSNISFKQDSSITYSPIERYLTYRQKTACRDQVFVHLDRNIYNPGDTIFFQAYIRDRFTGIFGTASVSLYAMLYNEKKIVMDSSRFRVYNSTCSGWMCIPAKAEPGKYHFAAFTGMMQNYDASEAFQLDLIVKERTRNQGKIEITFSKDQYKPGDTLEATVKITGPDGNPINQQMIYSSISTGEYQGKPESEQTNSEGESLIRFTLPDTITSEPHLNITTIPATGEGSISSDVRIPYNDPYFELRFLPEGGTYVQGLKQRIGFNATNFKGEPVYIEGLLKSNSGLTLDTIRSGTYGPDSFICTAHPGLYVEIIKGTETDKIWPLPVPTLTGLLLSVTPVDERTFAVVIQSNTYNGESVTVTGCMNTNLVFRQELTLNKKQRFVVNTDQLPAGIIQITLFNQQLKPVADRLFEVNSDQQLKFDIKTVNKTNFPGEETELEVSVFDGQGHPKEGFFSISVVDSIKGIDPCIFTPGIAYSYNVHPFFPGNLPPKVLSKGFENLADADRDLLLMVYGWVRFNWDFSQINDHDKQPVNYDILNIKVLNEFKNRRFNRNLDLISLEGPYIKHLVTNNSGEISLPLDSLSEITRSVTMMPDVKSKNPVMEAMLSIPYNEKYFGSNKLFIPQPAITSDENTVSQPAQFIQPNKDSISRADEYIPLEKKTIQLPQVIIKGHRADQKIYHDKYEKEYQYTRVKSLDYDMLWSSSNLEMALRKLCASMKSTNDAIYLSPSTSFFGGAVPALIVLDGTPIYEGGWAWVSTILPSQLTSLTVLQSSRGFTIYGGAAKGGVIFVNTRSDDPRKMMEIRAKWYMQNKKGNMLEPIYIFRPEIEFYTPTNLDIDADPKLQSRATIYWEPEVYFNGREPVRIRYNNLKNKGPVVITINGVSVDNLFGSGRGSYQFY